MIFVNFSAIINELQESFSHGENPFESCPFFNVDELDDLFVSKNFPVDFSNLIDRLMGHEPDSMTKFFMHCKMKTYPSEKPLIPYVPQTFAEHFANERLIFGAKKYGVPLGKSFRSARIDALQEIDMLNYCRLFCKEEDLKDVEYYLDQIVRIILK